MTEPTPQPYQPLTPVAAERKLRQLVHAMEEAQKALEKARDDEVAAKHEFERAHRRALLSPDCPKVKRGGYTVAERDAWVDLKTEDLREAFTLAKTARVAAADHLRTVRDQAVSVASLSKSVNTAYQFTGSS